MSELVDTDLVGDLAAEAAESLVEELGNATNGTLQATEAGPEEHWVMWVAQKLIDTAYSIAYMGLMFVTFSVGMVWYR